MDLTGLGIAEPTPDLLRAVCCRAVGDPAAELLGATASPVDHEIASIATAGLHRVTGLASTSAGARPWSAFVKVLQHARHWSMLPMLPPDRAADLVAVYPWREELDTRAQVLQVLPDGLRVPVHYAVEDLGDDRVAIWMEDVDAVDTPWTPADYERTAYALGRLAARRTPGLRAGASDLPAGLGVRKLVELRGPIFAATLADDAPWRAAVDSGLVDAGLRDDLARVLDLTPTVLAELDTLPTALPHGDASPANLLRPRSEPGTVVAIDWAFGCQLPLGHDLGQLLVGGAESGGADPALLPVVLETILPAHRAGLAAGGVRVPLRTLLRGCVGSLVTRTLPSAFPLEQAQGEPDPGQRAFLVRRAALARYLVDLVLAA